MNYDFIEVVIMDKYDEITPKVTRRIELLEALMFSFVEHALDLDKLDDIDRTIQGLHIKAVQ